jgi:hypothetical protein
MTFVMAAGILDSSLRGRRSPFHRLYSMRLLRGSSSEMPGAGVYGYERVLQGGGVEIEGFELELPSGPFLDSGKLVLKMSLK